METSIVPKIFDASIADAELGIETEAAYTMARRVAREEGLLIGVSAATALVGALQVVQDAPADSVIVTIFADSSDKYLIENF
jgi:cysteine synthase B